MPGDTGRSTDRSENIDVRFGYADADTAVTELLLTAQSLLEQTPDPTEAEIRDHLSGNVCRCTGYAGIVASVREAARLLREERS